MLFDAATIHDTASFHSPVQPAQGIVAVWVNGTLSWQHTAATGARAGRFLPRTRDIRTTFPVTPTL